MKEEEINLEDGGYEEVTPQYAQQKNQNQKNETPDTTGISNEQPGSNRPDLRVVQADRDKNGNVVYTNVGGMWKNVSKNGNEFYTLRIGQLKLLVFPNNNK
jgi:hypothetical protein